MMSVMFIGHGSPMNAIEDNRVTRGWKAMATAVDKPTSVLCISAHWYTRLTRVLSASKPRTIHDFGGFPRALYGIQYPAIGDARLVFRVGELLNEHVIPDDSWGLDHGAWSVLRHLYPDADVPVVQLSIDALASAEELHSIGKQLRPLREEGVLILGSGNVVHNLYELDMNEHSPYSWAVEFDEYIVECIMHHRFREVLDYPAAGACARKAFVTREHLDPLLMVLGSVTDEDSISVHNQEYFGGSISMTSFIFGA